MIYGGANVTSSGAAPGGITSLAADPFPKVPRGWLEQRKPRSLACRTTRPSYAPYPNMSAVGYPTAYPWQAWPNIGPFYPYPEVPLDWRAVTLRWDDGIWWLDFKKLLHSAVLHSLSIWLVCLLISGNPST